MASSARETTEYAPIQAQYQALYPDCFFQAFTAAKRHDPVILCYVQLFLHHYRAESSADKELVGTLLLERAFNEIQAEQVQQLSVQKGDNDPASDRTHTTKRQNLARSTV